ncbi:MAG TPA: hypothetical protein ENJ32_05415 [Crenotrichaceae bacterium]|nr:hypothetical protein [Crenotrichaceae bacterium]
MIFGEFIRDPHAQRYSEQIIELSTQGRLTEIIPADVCSHWHDEQTTFVQQTLFNTAQSKTENGPIYDSETKLTVVAWARIDNRDELAELLKIDLDDVLRCDPWFILKSYQQWGEQCVDYLIGDFVFVIFDRRAQKIFCARDHMGVRPFYYHLSEKRFIFGSHLAFFHQLECCELKPSSQWIADYLTGLSMSFTETPYPAIAKLAPAHCLTVMTKQSSVRPYFQFSTENTLKLNDSREYVDAYREQLEATIQCRVHSDYLIGSELSGGIDSSTITAYAAQFLAKPQQQLHAFAFTSCELEPEYIHAICQSTKLASTHVFTRANYEPDQRLELITKALDIFGYPQEHGNGTGHEPFYQMAEQLNIRTLLSGHGGDEFVTASAGLVLAELYHEGRYLELYNAVKGNAFTRLLRTLKIIANNYNNKTYNKRFQTAFSQRWRYQLVKQHWVEQYDLQSRYLKNAEYDAPYKTLNDFTLQNRWAPFVSTRMENCTLMAASHNIEYRWPLLDVRLIKLFLSIPSIEKYNHGVSRLLHRRAINDVVHHKVAWKPSKDMGPVYKLQDKSEVKPCLINIEKLHPQLSELIDVQKLRKQLSQSTQTHRSAVTNASFQNLKNINNLLWLNQWLHRYH